ncbi:MAG: biopolymer transporter ExbD [Saprospiraceae bacterium]|nr:biopolymer transporter ExbD [Saprospiraceae bacterium]
MALKRRNKVEPEFSLAAMIDVIFLLLMFFMLTSKLVNTNALNLKLPSSSSSAQVASDALSVGIKKDGTMYLDTKRMVSVQHLETALQDMIQKSGQEPKKTTVTISAEMGCPIEYVVSVMDITRRLGANAILATEPVAN